MHTSRRWFLLLAVAVAASGCSEAVSPNVRPVGRDLNIVVPVAGGSRATAARAGGPRLGSQTTPHFDVVEDGDQTPPDGLGPEWQVGTGLSVLPDAGFTDGYAYGQSVLNYWNVTNVKATVDIAVNGTGTGSGTQHGESETSTPLGPSNGGIIANASYYLIANCGNTVQAHAYGVVWSQAYVQGTLRTWGKKSDSGDKGAQQEVCTSENTSVSGTWWLVCSYLEVYNGLTGQWLFEVSLGCRMEFRQQQDQ